MKQITRGSNSFPNKNFIRTKNTNATTSSLSSKVPSSSNRFAIPSIGFSGAGFLGAYHAGVASCLLKHNYLLQPYERINHHDDDFKKMKPPILAGVSAGAIISAAISAGVKTDDAMNVLLEINARTQEKSNVILSSFTPGFSLVDQVEDLLMDALRIALGGSKKTGVGVGVGASSSGGDDDDDDDYDNELLMNRIDHGRLLHIGLTDRRTIMSSVLQGASNNLGSLSSSSTSSTTRDFLVKGNMNMYVHVSKYRNLKDVVAAAILSSYIPIGTGPLRVNEPNSKNTAVKHAFERLQEMEELGFLKHGVTGETIKASMYDTKDDHDDDEKKEEEGNRSGNDYHNSHRERIRRNFGDLSSSLMAGESYFWDGGLCNMFPSIDKSTLMVTPLNCKFSNPFIAPEAITENNHYLKVDDNVSLGMNMQNVRLFRKMLRSSDPSYLDQRFSDGFDDTHRFLKEKNLLRVFQR